MSPPGTPALQRKRLTTFLKELPRYSRNDKFNHSDLIMFQHAPTIELGIDFKNDVANHKELFESSLKQMQSKFNYFYKPYETQMQTKKETNINISSKNGSKFDLPKKRLITKNKRE